MSPVQQVKTITPYILSLLIAVSLGAYIFDTKGIPKPVRHTTKIIFRKIAQ